jgi:hypothetical protein
LRPLAREPSETGELILGLHALGGDLEAEGVGDRGNERGVVRVSAETVLRGQRLG